MPGSGISPPAPTATRRLSAQETGSKCPRCEKTVYPFEALNLAGAHWHPGCAKCKECNCALTIKTVVAVKAEVYCKVHVPKPLPGKIPGSPQSAAHSSVGISVDEGAQYVSIEKFLQLEALVVALQQKLSTIENLLQQQAWQYTPSSTEPPVTPKLTMHGSFSSHSFSPPPPLLRSANIVSSSLSDEDPNPLVVSFTPENSLLLDRQHTEVYTYDGHAVDTLTTTTTTTSNNDSSDNDNHCDSVDHKANEKKHSAIPDTSPSLRVATSTTATTTTITSPKPTYAAAAATKHPSASSNRSSSPSAAAASRTTLVKSRSTSFTSGRISPSSTSSSSASTSTLTPASPSTLTPASPSARTSQSSRKPSLSTSTSTTTSSLSPKLSPAVTSASELPNYTTISSQNMEPPTSYTVPPTSINNNPANTYAQPEALMYSNYLTAEPYSYETVSQVTRTSDTTPTSHETKYAYTPAPSTSSVSHASTYSSVVPIPVPVPHVSAEEMQMNERFQKWTHRTLELWQYFAKRNLDPVAAELEPHRLKLLHGVCGHPKDYMHFIQGIPNNAWQDRYYAATAAMSQRGLLGISRDLFRAVTTRVRVILEEINVPIHKKTIRAISAGGVAGGTKFFDNNILFKFPNDPKISAGSHTMHLYGGAEPDLERAAKAASNDLKGANALSNCWWHAFMPMAIMPQILVDYVGYRLIAMTWVDMTGAVLVSGSRDGGQTVVDEDEIARAALKYAAYHLHLAKHQVNGAMLYAAGDIEVHKNSDGRRYVLDLARTFPPEDPEETTHLPYVSSSVFFRMHRPTFLTHLKSLNSTDFPPLSPDALSRWGAIDAATHNTNVKRATHYLVTDRVRNLVHHLEANEVRWTRISALVQEWGISIRHLGLMRSTCREERLNLPSIATATATTTTAATAPSSSSSPSFQRSNRLTDLEDQILICMVSRAGKNLLRQELRQALLSKHVKQTIVDFMNSLTRVETSEHESFWSVKLPSDIRERFGQLAIIASEETKLSLMCHAHISSIVYYICSNTGIVLRPSVDWKLIGTPEFEFTIDMVQELCCRTKTLDFFEKFILDELISQACESRTAAEFVRNTMQMSQKKMPTLQLLETLEAVVPPHTLSKSLTDLSKLLKNKTSPLPTIDLQCLTIRALSLHFLGEISCLRSVVQRSVMELDVAVFALIRVIPQVFPQLDRESLFTEGLVNVCRTYRDSAMDGLITSLLAGKANCNARDPQSGESVLKICNRQQSFSVAQLLLNARADPNLPDLPVSSIQEAVIQEAVSEPPSARNPTHRKQVSLVVPLTPFQEAKVKFDAAASAIKTFRSVTDERKLVLYGLFKQATVGDVQGAQPEKVQIKEALPGSYVETIQYEAWAKWNAWNSVNGMSKEAAMEAYAQEVEKQQFEEANVATKKPAPPPPRPRSDSGAPS